jgi:manganese efflux pump family protein
LSLSRQPCVLQASPQHFPVAVVGLHGVLAATTLVLVLLTAIGVGGS